MSFRCGPVYILDCFLQFMLFHLSGRTLNRKPVFPCPITYTFNGLFGNRGNLLTCQRAATLSGIQTTHFILRTYTLHTHSSRPGLIASLLQIMCKWYGRKFAFSERPKSTQAVGSCGVCDESTEKRCWVYILHTVGEMTEDSVCVCVCVLPVLSKTMPKPCYHPALSVLLSWLVRKT